MRSSVALIALSGLAGAAVSYQLALPGYRYEFPRDHFNHEDYQTEWWYYTGNLRAPDGHRFGFELTFFRRAVARDPEAASPWKLDDVYVAHLALSDISGRRFFHASRLNRSGPGFAGADLSQARVWNGNWQVDWRLPAPESLSTSQTLRAFSPEFSLGLDLQSKKPPVIHGQDGVSRKSARAGHASHYVSFTRLETRGKIELRGRPYTVSGTSWMDHEFFTHQLEQNQTGWDWFSLQFRDNTELMLFRIRRKDGSADPYSAGTFVRADGTSRHLTSGEFSLSPGRTWTSPVTNGVYPIAWTVRVPALGIVESVSTPLESQELTSSNEYMPSYWEGAIDATGTRSGWGYLEMTGYARPVSGF